MVIKVLVAGEAAAGKTSLIRKFMDPSCELPSSTRNWDSSPALVHNTKVAGQNVRITEVQGSRGRMPNIYTLMKIAKYADVMVFCYPATSEWHLSSFERTVRAIEARAGRKSPLPAVLVQLQSETADLSAEAEQVAKKFKVRFVRASAAENTNISAVFEAAVAAALESKGAEPQQDDEEQGLVVLENQQIDAGSFKRRPPPPPLVQLAPKPQQPKVAPKKSELAAVWEKIVAKFVGGDQPAVKQTKSANEEAVDALAGDVAPIA